MIAEEDCDFAGFLRCYERKPRLREGYWSPFATLVWIITRDDQYVAATRLYEEEEYANRGGLHTSACWLTIGNAMGNLFGRTLTDAQLDLKEGLESALLIGGVARSAATHKERNIERHEWVNFQRAFENFGLSLLPGLFDFCWPSDAVRSAFPSAEDDHTSASEPTMPRWRQQRLGSAQAGVFKFLSFAGEYLPGGRNEESRIKLHARYSDWAKRQRPSIPILRRTSFEKWLDRYAEGYRSDGSRLVMSQ